MLRKRLSPANVVTLDGAQTVSGAKTFSDTVTMTKAGAILNGSSNSATISLGDATISRSAADTVGLENLSTAAASFSGTITSTKASGNAMVVVDGTKIGLNPSATTYVQGDGFGGLIIGAGLGGTLGGSMTATGALGADLGFTSSRTGAILDGSSNSATIELGDVVLSRSAASTLSLNSGSGSLAAATATLSTSLVLSALNGTAGSGTGITTNATSQVRTFLHKITVTEAALTDADGSQDITLWTVPAKTKIQRVVAECTANFTGGGAGAVTVSVGPTGSETGYLVATSIFSGTPVIGDAEAELGTLVVGGIGHIPSFSGTTAIVARFAADVNVADLTTGSCTFWIEGLVYS